MELVLNTPRQRWIYENIWPHPGSRFGNDWTDAQNWEKTRWLYKTWAQRTGFSPPVVSDNWKETTPWVRDAAQKVEKRNRQTGIDELFLPTDFIDQETHPADAEPEETGIDTAGAFGSLERKSSKIEKYIVIALAVIAGILILKAIL